MNIAAGLSALNAATNFTRSLRDELKSGTIKGDEIIGRIGEICDHIVDSKEALIEAGNEIQALKDQLRVFNDRKQIDNELYHDGRVYWRTHENKRTGPYCPFCWDKDKRLVTLTLIHEGNFAGYDGVHRRYDCSVPGQRFFIPTPGGR